MMNAQFLFLILLFPLLGGVTNAVLGMRLPRRVSTSLALASVLLSAGTTLVLWPLAQGTGARATLFTWLSSGDLRVPVEILFDPLSASMCLMVTLVSSLIHLYGLGYMKEEGDYARFFALLNLFVFAMLCILLADNLLLLFLGWEGVGFCSYALIGYWYGEEKNALAGRKAFLVTRVADVFLALALLLAYKLTGTLSISALNEQAPGLAPAMVTLMGILLLLGACGKSAQLPFMTWLPDAMAGPTPVSALIHAATMVTAGVYLLCRLFPLVSLSETALAAVALVGAATAFYAATCALAQKEIKRVLAYSTMSQVGYMFLAVGAGSVSGALFHLLTHAFFKALLFMGAGCIIHLAARENDIHRMGGLARRSPAVFYLFLAGILCLAGAPLTGGFFSKDAILLATFLHQGALYKALWGLGVLTALLTALYSFRLLYLVFAGESRGEVSRHGLPPTMLYTLPPLALAGLFGGLLNLPAFWGGGERLGSYLGTLSGISHPADHRVEMLLIGVAVAVFFAGWLLAQRRYRRYSPTLQAEGTGFLLKGWGADWLVARMVLGPFRAFAEGCWRQGDLRIIEGLLGAAARGCQGCGELFRRMTTGRLSTYLDSFAWGLLLVLGWFIFSRI